MHQKQKCPKWFARFRSDDLDLYDSPVQDGQCLFITMFYDNRGGSESF